MLLIREAGGTRNLNSQQILRPEVSVAEAVSNNIDMLHAAIQEAATCSFFYADEPVEDPGYACWLNPDSEIHFMSFD